MEKFVKPEMEIVEYEPKDIIATSTSGGNEQYEEGCTDGWF